MLHICPASEKEEPAPIVRTVQLGLLALTEVVMEMPVVLVKVKEINRFVLHYRQQ